MLIHSRPMNLEELGGRIKRRRMERKLRQQDLANVLGISAQAVSKWERGKSAPDISQLSALARLLEVSVEWILGGTSPDHDTFEATVFLTGLQGFAKRAKSLAPRDLATWTNGVFYTLTEMVLRFDGVPVKYIGDGFLAFFTGADHAQRALNTGIWAQRIIDSGELVISLHAGEIYLGTVGHPDYARPDILGDTVNQAFIALPWIAQRAEQRIGLSESVRKQLSTRARVRPLGTLPSEQTERANKTEGSQASLAMFEPNNSETSISPKRKKQ